MSTSSQIINNFQMYNNFLSTLKNKDKRIATSLKMMYSIHMENIKADKNKLFVIKQLLRFTAKFIYIPFAKISLEGLKHNSNTAILENIIIEKDISKNINIPVVKFKKSMEINLKALVIYKKLFRAIYILFMKSNLKKLYIISLIHRLIDYLIVYETLNIDKLELLLMENDRVPQNLALIHLLQDAGKTTVKYDNWLIDPIHHNDIYCDYYFYPSLYHKDIIENFSYNKKLKYIKGGFLDWDKLSHYKDTSNDNILSIVYFTQFGIAKNEHKQYISDIVDIMDSLELEYILTIKTHPREKITDYKEFRNISNNIEIIDISNNIYTLISKANFCFSVFSTISIEAKHIVDNSYFINYNSEHFEIVNYDKIKLDLIKNKNILNDVLRKQYTPIIREIFLENNNGTFPNTNITLERFLNGFNNNPIV